MVVLIQENGQQAYTKSLFGKMQKLSKQLLKKKEHGG